MFELYKTAGYLLSFPGIIPLFFLLSALVAALRKYKKLSFFFVSLAAFFYLTSTQFFSYVLSKVIYVEDSEDRGAFIVVLGGGKAEYDGRVELTKSALSRLLKAFELYKERPRKILVTGGVVDKGPPEAHLMREFLLKLGVPDRDIIVEDRAKNTRENAERSFEITGDVPITLVTSSTHMFRALSLFSRFYSTVYHVQSDLPTDFKNSYIDYLPTITGFTDFCMITRELIGLLFEALRSGLKAPTPALEGSRRER